MPEASNLTVSINDKVVGRTHILAPNGVRTTEFDIPAGPAALRLQRGAHRRRAAPPRRLLARRDLRAVDADRSVADRPRCCRRRSRRRRISLDLAALPADAQGALPIRAVIPRKTSLPNIENIIRAAQMIVADRPLRAAGRSSSGRSPKARHGINLVIGTAEELSGLNQSLRLGPRTGRASSSSAPNRDAAHDRHRHRAEQPRKSPRRCSVSSSRKEQRGSPPGLRAAVGLSGLSHGGRIARAVARSRRCPAKSSAVASSAPPSTS